MSMIQSDGGVVDESIAPGQDDGIFTSTTAARWGMTYQEYLNVRKALDSKLKRPLSWYEDEYGKEFIVKIFDFESGVEGYDKDSFQWDIAKTYGLASDPYRTSGGGTSGPTKAEQYAAAAAAIRNMSMSLGYADFTEDNIQALARTVVNGDWSSDQLNDYLVSGAMSNWDTLKGGQLTGAVDQIKARASQQLVMVSDATARQWAARLVSGEMTEEGLTSLLQQQATARFGWAADVISKGITMEDFLAPSRDRIAQELEIDPRELSLTDPKIMSMLTVNDPKGGQRVATDTELVMAARKDGRWKSTAGARNTTAAAAQMLRQYLEGY